jgi:hypothetical protein
MFASRKRIRTMPGLTITPAPVASMSQTGRI